MDEILQLPSRRIEPVASPDLACWTAADASAHIRSVWGRLTAANQRRDVVIAAALDAAKTEDHTVERFSERVESRLLQAATTDLCLASLIYDCAADALLADKVAEAWVGLIVLLDAAQLRSLAMLGLAVCAARIGRVQDALALALGARAADPSHPRALLIAGHSERERGHLRRAQQYFAVASRLARHRSGHAAELRMAQRLLLTLHMV